MAEVYKTRRLIIASTVFILIILIGFLTLRTPDYEYKLNVDQTIEGISLSDNLINTEEARKLTSDKNHPFLIIDIRSHNEFLTNHIEGAINIPVSEILEEDNFTLLNEADQKNTAIVMYGKDPLQANASWLLLKQLGIRNLKFLPLGFDQFLAQKNENFLTNFKVEEMNSEILSNSQVNAPVNANDLSKDNNTQTKINPAKKVKKAVTAGGC